MATTPANLPLEEIHDFLVALARKAGHVISSADPSTAESGTKMNSADLVTETDRHVETLVRRELRDRWGDGFAFMGEETYREGDVLGDEPTFIVDPIDGTTNFVHAHPYVCVSLGLAVRRRPVVGIVYNPFTDHLYTAITGRGAHLTSPTHDRARLPLRSPPPPLQDLSHCLVAVEWGSDRAGPDYEVKVATFRALCAARGADGGGAMVHGIRSLGSAELNLCAVAAGHLDAYWEAGCWAWDVCAGWVVLEESGGLMVGAHPGDWEPAVDQRRYLAVRGGEGQRAIVEEFWSCVQGRLEVGYDRVSSK